MEKTRTKGLARGAALAIPLALPLLAFAAAALQPFVPPEDLLRDPLAVGAGGPAGALAGAASQLGVMAWSGTAFAVGLGAVILYGRGDRSAASLLLAIALFSSFLALDDGLMLHETFGRRVFGVKLFKTAYLVGLASVAVLFLRLSLRRAVSARLPALFGAAIALFLGSMTVDDLLPQEGAVFLIEDGLKLAGLGAWSAFASVLACDLIEGGTRKGPSWWLARPLGLALALRPGRSAP